MHETIVYQSEISSLSHSQGAINCFELCYNDNDASIIKKKKLQIQLLQNNVGTLRNSFSTFILHGYFRLSIKSLQLLVIRARFILHNTQKDIILLLLTSFGVSHRILSDFMCRAFIYFLNKFPNVIYLSEAAVALRNIICFLCFPLIIF